MRLTIKQAEEINGELLIKKLAVIDETTGQELKVVKVTPQLVQFFLSIEIDVSNFLAFQDMKEKNPNIKKLVDSFKLYT